MTCRIAKALPDTTLEEIAMMMKTENTGAIPVVDEDELVGIVTDRDIVMRCVADGGDATQMTAEDIVSEDVETIDPESDVHEAMELMSQKQVRRLPVVDNGELIGMISLGDIAVKQGDHEGSARALQNVSRPLPQPDVLARYRDRSRELDPRDFPHGRVIPFRIDAARGRKKSSNDKAS
ncbi:MAG: CBS domain-containing protein [Chthoniobacterales bacterium]